MARILKLIESEIEALVAEEPRDLEVLDDSLRYLINYADKIHHAKEDIIFKIIELAEKNRVAFAFPSQSLYVEQLPPKDKS